MGRTLESVKSTLSKAFLGRYGIHGIGPRESENVICIHVKSRGQLVAAGVLPEIEKEAAPFSVIVVEDEPPFLAKRPETQVP